jgi:hypothetical protein
MIDGYCKIFSLEWKNNPRDFLSQSPLYLEGNDVSQFPYDDFKAVVDEVKQASIDYLPKLIQRLDNY